MKSPLLYILLAGQIDKVEVKRLQKQCAEMVKKLEKTQKDLKKFEAKLKQMKAEKK